MPKRLLKRRPVKKVRKVEPKEFNFSAIRERNDYYGYNYSNGNDFKITHDRKTIFSVSIDGCTTCCGIKSLSDYVVNSSDVALLTRAFKDPEFDKWCRKLYDSAPELYMITATTKTKQERAMIDALLASGWKDCGRGNSTHSGEDDDDYWGDYEPVGDSKEDSDNWSEYEVVLLTKVIKQ